MVCMICGGKTEVINSRRQKRANQVWRRRRCLECLRVFTSHEAVDLGAIFSVKRSSATEPFIQDKLYTEILLALQDRRDCYSAAKEVAATVTQKVIKNASDGLILAPDISLETAKVLKRLDKRSWMRFAADHPSLGV